jgi:NTE family protein
MKKLCLVLGAGGMRGRAHIGVIRRLVKERIPVHSIIGCSAGALVAAYYAACGLDQDELNEKVSELSGWHLISFAVAVRKLGFLSKVAHRFSGKIPNNLELLEGADFQKLFHGVEKLGVLVFELQSMKELFLHTGSTNYGITLAEAVRSSAATPILYPPRRIIRSGKQLLLTDGGVSDPLPVKYAFSPYLGADIALAVNISKPYMIWRKLRRIKEKFPDRVLVVHPQVSFFGTIISSRRKTEHLIEKGEESLHHDVIRQLQDRLELSK